MGTEAPSVSEQLHKSLTSKEKFIPTWFRYDKQGSIYNDICLTECEYYYMHRCEQDVFSRCTAEIVKTVPPPWILGDMGSGNAVKTRHFLNIMTEQNKDAVQYVPVDISEEFLEEMASAIREEYKGRLTVHPVAGDYSRGIKQLREMAGNKLILWLGGFQNIEYNQQIQYIKDFASIMTENDRLGITLDITQDAEQVENAYLDPTGVCAPLYLNALLRLNRDYRSNIDVEKFSLEVKFVKHSTAEEPNYVLLNVVANEAMEYSIRVCAPLYLNALHRLNRDYRSNIDVDKFSLEVKFVEHSTAEEPNHVLANAVANKEMEYNIPGLNMTLRLEKGERIRLSDGKGVSCKYTLDQIKHLAEAGGTTLSDVWPDKENHVAFCSFAVRK